MQHFIYTNLQAVADRAHEFVASAVTLCMDNHSAMELLEQQVVAAKEYGDMHELASLTLAMLELQERAIRMEDPSVDSTVLRTTITTFAR